MIVLSAVHSPTPHSPKTAWVRSTWSIYVHTHAHAHDLNFANAARQLGSSVGILSSSYHLRERLAQILYLFRENAADLFPRKVARQPRESYVNPNQRHLQRNKRKKTHTLINPVVTDDLEAEELPRQLKDFADDVTTFLDCLNEFPEFSDEGLNSSIISLKGDLQVRASREYHWSNILKSLHSTGHHV